MIRIASVCSLLLAMVAFVEAASAGAAQAAPPNVMTFQVFTKGGTLTPTPTAIPALKPIAITPGSLVTTFPNGTATIENPPAASELPANTVPFTLTASGQILLTTHVGAHTLHFVLDTGASTTGVLPASAAKLKVRLDPDETNASGYKFATLSEVAIGGIKLKAVPVVVTEMAALNRWNGQHPDQPIDGVLGIDILKKWALGLDMPAQTLTFWKGGHVTQNQIIAFQTSGLHRYAGLPNHQELIKTTLAQPMPMHHKAEDPEHPFYSVSVQLDQVKAELDVDTGAQISTLPNNIAVGLKPLVTTSAAVRTLDGDIPITTMALRAMKIGPLTVDFPLVAAQPPNIPKAFTSATLGRPCFDRCQVVLDFPASTLSVARLVDESTARVLLPAMGIFPNAQADRLSVLVQRGSAAAEAGIQQNDQILTVEETNTLLPGGKEPDLTSPTNLTLTIRRPGNTELLKFSLRVLWITGPLLEQPIACPEGGRLYNAALPGGHVEKPGNTFGTSIESLLLFNPKPAGAP